jgi:hypothetical protein
MLRRITTTAGDEAPIHVRARRYPGIMNEWR